MKTLVEIAHIRCDFPTKFGLPKQAGLVEEIEARVVFTPEYRVKEALRGLENFSHLWILWGFHQAERETWSPTVRPPRLGGNRRVGVFATRSPFRPNAIGMSAVRLVRMEETAEGTVLVVSGADMMDGTPVYDIKPYLPYADARMDATETFTQVPARKLHVNISDALLSQIPANARKTLMGALSQDPRPSYHHSSTRVYTMPYAHQEVRFTVEGEELTVVEIVEGGEA